MHNPYARPVRQGPRIRPQTDYSSSLAGFAVLTVIVYFYILGAINIMHLGWVTGMLICVLAAPLVPLAGLLNLF